MTILQKFKSSWQQFKLSYRRATYHTYPLESIVLWNKDRNLFNYDATAEDAMLAEELNELSAARALNDTHGMIDAYCDIIVLATGAIHKLGYEPNLAMAETILEISSRKGAIDPSTGKWQKDINQDPSTLYKANYTDAEAKS